MKFKEFMNEEVLNEMTSKIKGLSYYYNFYKEGLATIKKLDKISQKFNIIEIKNVQFNREYWKLKFPDLGNLDSETDNNEDYANKIYKELKIKDRWKNRDGNTVSISSKDINK